jgi:hypothetical protein
MAEEETLASYLEDELPDDKYWRVQTQISENETDLVGVEVSDEESNDQYLLFEVTGDRIKQLDVQDYSVVRNGDFYAESEEGIWFNIQHDYTGTNLAGRFERDESAFNNEFIEGMRGLDLEDAPLEAFGTAIAPTMLKEGRYEEWDQIIYDGSPV